MTLDSLLAAGWARTCCLVGLWLALPWGCGRLEIGSYDEQVGGGAPIAGAEGLDEPKGRGGSSATGSGGLAGSTTTAAGPGNGGIGGAAGHDAGGAPGWCGNGRTEGSEECDGGGETYDCNADCTHARCGDEKLNRARDEECDDGVASELCDSNCTFAFCGDSTTNRVLGEECDTGGDSYTCDADCTAPSCGDGHVNEVLLEQCDDGNQTDGDGCSSLCQAVFF